MRGQPRSYRSINRIPLLPGATDAGARNGASRLDHINVDSSFQLLAALPEQSAAALPTNTSAIGVRRLLFPLLPGPPEPSPIWFRAIRAHVRDRERLTPCGQKSNSRDQKG